MNAVLKLELIVGLLASFTMLTIFIWSVKKGGFDDSKKMMDGMLFDSEDDLQDAVNKENKQKALKEKKLKEIEKSKEEG
jgi:cbb3-type cytochrome oxidase maturation protein